MDTLIEFLGWATLINYLILCLWFGLFAFAKNWLYNLHTTWFDISKPQFDVIHYTAMAIYKLFIAFFAMIPFFILLAIR
ncbi:DUF6868 family protein [Litoribrevibacter albus]|uniref:DUF6868 domain-containing protein n=1 Tax=Litoribrevibacter albus TaxID=1473156 RepID=A0AA37S9R6_9GAMM|nr:hypothetical protein [Litoribrevibacter albus]GLQ31096.1 hypothetical protein GCM10007876_15750 [Litoribrevibacter albus]